MLITFVYIDDRAEIILQNDYHPQNKISIFNQKRSALNQTAVSGGLGPIVEEAALTQSTVVAVVAVGQEAVELEQVDNPVEVRIAEAAVAVAHRTAALVALAALEAPAALGPLVALEALVALQALAALGPLVALEALAVLEDLVALGFLAALEALVETKQGHLVRPRYVVAVY